MKTRKFMIIDGNALVYRAFHALPPLTTKKGQLVNAVYGFATIFLKAMKEIEPDYVAVTFDVSEETFRTKEYADYKAGRAEQPQELYDQFPLIKDLMEAFRVKIYEKEGYEADDLIGTLTHATQIYADKNADLRGMKNIILSGDMDMLQLVNKNTEVHAPKKGMSEIFIYTPESVKERYGLTPDQMIDYKSLRGDPSDNIPGVKGIGEKTSTELLKDFKTLAAIYEYLQPLTPKNLEGQDLSKFSRIKPAVIKKLVEHKMDAYLSQKLVTIILNVKTGFKLEDCKVQTPDIVKAVELFQKLGFKSLIGKLPKPETQSLFDTGNKQLTTNDKLKVVSRKRSGSYVLLDTKDKFNNFIKQLKKQKIFAIDTETTGLDSLTAELLGISISWQKGAGYYIPFTNLKSEILNLPAGEAGLKSILEDPEVGKVGHHIKYDLEIFHGAGVNLQGIQFDTMLAAYLIYPGSRSYSLDNLSFTELGHQMIPIEDLIGPKGKDQKTMRDVPLEELAEYASEDADFTWRLYEKFSKSLSKDNLYKLFQDVEMPLVEILAQMEEAGIKIDSDHLNNLTKKFKTKINRAEDKIFKLAGEKFNVASPKQLKEVLFEKMKIDTRGLGRTKTGISTAAGELDKLKGTHKIIDPIIDFREYSKLVNTYTDALPDLVRKQTGRVHTSFNQTIAATGRLSSSGPNLQNIPIRGEWGPEIRKAFIAERGYKLIAADYSQIELRIVASLAEDKKMIESFKKGEDIHARTAAEVYNVALDKVTSDQRREAKEVNFGILYGLGPRGMSLRAGVPYERAKEFYNKYFELHSTIKNYLDSIKNRVKSKGYVATLFGRRRYLPDIHAEHPMLRAQAERMAVNLPIQGTAADLMKMAMIDVAREIKKKNFGNEVRMLLQVHDELVFEVKNDKVDIATKLIKAKMEGVYKLRVPVEVHVGVGQNWEEAK